LNEYLGLGARNPMNRTKVTMLLKIQN